MRTAELKKNVSRDARRTKLSRTSTPKKIEHSRRTPKPEVQLEAEVSLDGTAPQGKLTLIRAHADVGFGNTLFVRGEGNGLSWDEGAALCCVSPGTWVWVGLNVTERITFKLLINDAAWSQGENLVIDPGESLEVSPSF